jgi:hypothetical protein
MTGTLNAARSTVAANPCASTAAAVGSTMALVAYGASFAGVNLPAWSDALITGGATAGFLAFSRGGIMGVWRFILYGRGGG